VDKIEGKRPLGRYSPRWGKIVDFKKMGGYRLGLFGSERGPVAESWGRGHGNVANILTR